MRTVILASEDAPTKTFQGNAGEQMKGKPQGICKKLSKSSQRYPKKRIVRKKSKKKIFGKVIWESETEETVYPIPTQLEEERKGRISLKGGPVGGTHEFAEKRREDYGN